MARTIGLRGGLWTIGLTGLLVVLPLSIVAPLAGALGLGSLGLMAAILTAIVQQRRAARLTVSQEKLSSEIGVLSQRLLKAEAAITVAARAVLTRTDAPATLPQTPGPDNEALAAGVEEVTREIGLLSGIVRELAAVVATQEAEIGRLKTEREAAPPSAPPPKPAAAVPPELTAGPRSVPARQPTPEPVIAFKPPAFATANRDPAQEAALVEAFDADGLEVWLQPVVTLPQRKVVSYEALARLKLGSEILSPDAFLPVLERHGRTTALDRRMIRSSAVIARHLQGRGSNATVAYGLSPLSLFEPDFLRSLVGLVSGDADLAGRVAVALPQASWRSLDPEQVAVLGALRGRIGFGLDRPTDLRFDVGLLAERGVSQIKVPTSLLLRPPSRDAVSDIAIEDLVASLGRAGIRLVATQVERESEVPDLIDLDVPLAQGTVFAGPKAVRAEVFAETQQALARAPAGAEAEAQPAGEPPQQRRAFRDFLRRAV
ncbi:MULTISPECIES: EAL domain-containing protein [Methylobacterium]|uniref:Cyclic di-GMP phosphodiesterase PdeK n=1 Tax=Methylobacterium thuringiense TaxID=1003091 RepID=A0ABQ4TR69_9HYPH|nr:MULTISPECIES: EAL domain-containing protein [Methylobacterium]GJE57111.1 putative cyclic di-GMP phosphodiesterase PdeK [Methylobacterium thuringiense]